MPFIFAAPLLFGGGYIAGFYASSVGSGSLLSFPILLFTGMPTHIAIATNRFALLFGETASAIQYQRHGAINFRLALLLSAVASIGSYIGSHIVLQISDDALNIIVALLLLPISIVLLLKPRLGSDEHALTKKKKIFLVLLAFPIGVYGGFFGAGYGTFLTIALAACGFSFLQSAAIARVVSIFVSLVATLSFVSFGAIQYREGMIMAVGYTIGAWMGVKTSMRRGNEYIRFLLLMVTALAIAKLLWEVM